MKNPAEWEITVRFISDPHDDKAIVLTQRATITDVMLESGMLSRRDLATEVFKDLLDNVTKRRDLERKVPL